LDWFAQKYNPLVKELNLRGYYWTLLQGEYATDIIFKDPSHLRSLYQRLIRHAIEHFSCEDVLRFLGRKTKGWIPMRKSVADIYRRVEVSRQANTRYLEALSVMGDQRPSRLIGMLRAHELVKKVLPNTALSYYPERASRNVDLIVFSQLRDLLSSTSKLYLKTLSKKRSIAALYYREPQSELYFSKFLKFSVKLRVLCGSVLKKALIKM
jgi:hypothetical protein